MDNTSIDKIRIKVDATVGDLINHLQTHFKPEDRLCFWHEGGAYMICVNITKSMLGKDMFVYVKDDKERRMKQFNDTQAEVDEQYEYVGNDDVLVY